VLIGMGVSHFVVAFVRFAGHLRSVDLRALQEEYVATFDHTHRGALPAGGPP